VRQQWLESLRELVKQLIGERYVVVRLHALNDHMLSLKPPSHAIDVVFSVGKELPKCRFVDASGLPP
jgi:hypothetical protein